VTQQKTLFWVLQTATTNRPIEDKPDRESWWSVLTEIGFWINRKFTVKSPSQFKPVISLDQDGTIFARNTLGSITLYPTGYITVTNPTGTMTMGGSGWELVTGGSVNIQSPGLTWNGQTVAVVGGTDSRGDTTLS
jgi:hypothetical protein